MTLTFPFRFLVGEMSENIIKIYHIEYSHQYYIHCVGRKSSKRTHQRKIQVNFKTFQDYYYFSSLEGKQTGLHKCRHRFHHIKSSNEIHTSRLNIVISVKATYLRDLHV